MDAIIAAGDVGFCPTVPNGIPAVCGKSIARV
jgi:hypothetical protein